MFVTQFYIQWQYKYLHVHKKTLNEKKCLRFFNKKTPLYAGLGSKQKTFSNYQATYQKELCLLIENQAIFSQIERTYRFDPSRSSSLFKDPLCTSNALFEWPVDQIFREGVLNSRNREWYSFKSNVQHYNDGTT